MIPITYLTLNYVTSDHKKSEKQRGFYYIMRVQIRGKNGN